MESTSKIRQQTGEKYMQSENNQSLDTVILAEILTLSAP